MAERILTTEQIDEIVDLREKGHSYKWIADKLGVSPGCVSWHCLEKAAEPPNPVTPRPVPTEAKIEYRFGHTIRRFTVEEDEELLRLEATGMNLSKIAKALGRKRNSITGRLMSLARREARLEAAQ